MAESAQPLVFGHRGASGYRPENTIEAIELAFAQGADAIECDLVPTRDGHLVVRHENSLQSTTDVAKHVEFADRRRLGYADGHQVSDWFTEDFSLAELATLRAVERLPELRPGSAKFDGQFVIPSLDALLAKTTLDGKTLILEVKHGAHFESIALDPVPMLDRALRASNFAARGIRVIFETFDEEVLDAILATSGDLGSCVFLTELSRIGSQSLPDLLDRLATKFAGVSIDLDLLFAHPEIVGLAHQRGLQIYAWTARAEDAVFSVEEYYYRIIETGVDGIFADQPDLLRRTIDGMF